MIVIEQMLPEVLDAIAACEPAFRDMYESFKAIAKGSKKQGEGVPSWTQTRSE